jgi:hypothetical protein
MPKHAEAEVVSHEDMHVVLTSVIDLLKGAGYRDADTALIQVAGCLLGCAADIGGVSLDAGLKAAAGVARAYQKMSAARHAP